jgi:PAS domain S-box-containing protein
LQSEGKNVGVVIFVRDITERKRAEKALIQSEEKFRTIFENAPIMIDSFDENGQCMLWNEECEKVLGWTRQEMFLADEPLSVFYSDKETREKVLDSIHRSDGIFREYEVTAKDGDVRIQRWADFRLPNGDIISVGYDITERKKAEEELKKSLKEKELLLQEIHHRVRNNLQVISGLLNMHIRQSKYDSLKDSLNIVNNRIQAIAYVHHNLYKSDDFSKVNFENFVRDLSIHLLDTFGVYGAIDITVNAEDIALGIENAVPCALIVNELITNSINHAFPDNSGKINVILRAQNSHLGLHVIDNGIGLPEEIDFQHPDSTGLNIIRLLVRQLDGEIDVSRENGTDVKITFVDN